MAPTVERVLSVLYPPTVDVAEWVRQERERRGWTPQELADRAGLDRVEVNAVERGRNKATSARIRDGLARAFGVHPAEIGGGKRPRSDPPDSSYPSLGNAAAWQMAEAAYRATHPDKFSDDVYTRARAMSFSSLPDPVDEDFVADVLLLIFKRHWT